MPDAGHVPFDDGWCLDRVLISFFQRGSAEGLDVSGVESLTPPPFELR